MRAADQLWLSAAHGTNRRSWVRIDIGSWLGRAAALHVLGDALAAAGKPGEAAARWRQAMDIYEMIGCPQEPLRARLVRPQVERNRSVTERQR